VPAAVFFRPILYPVSEAELSTHVRLMRLEDTAVAVARVAFARGVVPLVSLHEAQTDLNIKFSGGIHIFV